MTTTWSSDNCMMETSSWSVAGLITLCSRLIRVRNMAGKSCSKRCKNRAMHNSSTKQINILPIPMLISSCSRCTLLMVATQCSMLHTDFKAKVRQIFRTTVIQGILALDKPIWTARVKCTLTTNKIWTAQKVSFMIYELTIFWRTQTSSMPTECCLSNTSRLIWIKFSQAAAPSEWKANQPCLWCHS